MGGSSHILLSERWWQEDQATVTLSQRTDSGNIWQSENRWQEEFSGTIEAAAVQKWRQRHQRGRFFVTLAAAPLTLCTMAAAALPERNFMWRIFAMASFLVCAMIDDILSHDGFAAAGCWLPTDGPQLWR